MVLTQVYPKPDETAKVSVQVDIIAVHGLNPSSKKETNHAWDTWRTPAGPKGKLWLRDDLPELVPNARIFLYEYDSTVVYGTNNSTFVDKANSLLEAIRIKQMGQDENSLRPVILLGHSLGGLLIKQALINAYNNEKYKTVKLATQGLVFFATPHKGGRQGLLNLGQVASAIARNLGFEKGDNILNTLEKEGMFGQLMDELWRHRLLEYPIVSFWGEYDSIVTKESASFGLPGKHEHIVSLPASHGGICKFGDGQQDKDNLERVTFNIFELCQSAVKLRRKKKDEIDETRDAKVKKILGDVSNISCVEAKNRNPTRVDGTCQWFIYHSRFKKWLKSDSGLLWVSADPGCGKSVLSRYLVDDVSPSSPERITCYFFFKDDIQEQKCARTALRCILYQVYDQRPDLFSEKLLKTMKGTFLTSFAELWQLLVSVTKNNEDGEMVCILDGLDECMPDSRHKLIESLNNFFLYDRGYSGLKFLATSRPYNDIRLGFHTLKKAFPHIHLSGENAAEMDQIEKEITLVIFSRVRELAEKHLLDAEEEATLKAEVMKRHNRTYLWVYLVFEDMKTWGGFTKGRIREQLQSLPIGVYEAYEKILSRSLDAKTARKLLQVVLVATRALTLKEMAVALAIKNTYRTNESLEVEKEDRFRANVRELCGLFVSIIDDKLYLIHQTAAEFLLQSNTTDGVSSSTLNSGYPSSWQGSFSLESANRVLALICAHYLLRSGDSRSKIKRDPKFDEFPMIDRGLHTKFPFLKYCITYWYIHIRRMNSSDTKDLHNLHELCLPEWKKYWPALWAILHSLRKIKKHFHPDYHCSDPPPPLVLASGLGLAVLTSDLLRQKDIRSNKATIQIALALAVRLNRKSVVQTFIEAEYKYRQLQGLSGKITGQRLFDFERLQMWQLFGVRFSLLGLAVSRGNEDIVDQLLGTQCVTVTEDMLFTATKNRHLSILQTLHRTGQVEINCRDKDGWSLVRHALERRWSEAVDYLLRTNKYDTEMEINSDTEYFRRILLSMPNPSRPARMISYVDRAAIDDDYQLLKVLIETGKAKLDDLNVCGETPLAFACSKNCIACVKQLLATKKVTVDFKDKYGRSLLSKAASAGFEKVVRELVRYGANVNSQDKDGNTPIMEAALRNRVDCVKVLLRTGEVDIHHVNVYHQTLLVQAARYEALFLSLFRLSTADPGFDIHKRDVTGGTLLSWVAQTGSKMQIREVFEANPAAGVETDHHGRTPLWWAMSSNIVGSVREMLVLCPSAANMKDVDGESPFSLCCKRGSEGIYLFALLKRYAPGQKEECSG